MQVFFVFLLCLLSEHQAALLQLKRECKETVEKIRVSSFQRKSTLQLLHQKKKNKNERVKFPCNSWNYLKMLRIQLNTMWVLKARKTCCSSAGYMQKTVHYKRYTLDFKVNGHKRAPRDYKIMNFRSDAATRAFFE